MTFDRWVRRHRRRSRGCHDRNLKAFLERARERNLRLNADKLKLKMTQVPYIGDLLTRKGLRVDTKKV